MNKKESQILGTIMTFLLLISMVVVAKESARLVGVWHERQIKDQMKTVVIDAGHGGNDPGKVGINGALEKDINLAIAMRVKQYLEQEDINVIMTRQEDKGLYDENDTNKKVHDMKERLHIIESSTPSLAVSIHQNSYPEAGVSGIQVFYYRDSNKGKDAAIIMQEQLISTLKPEKERVAKENTSYYLLKKTSVPLIIVECGFLSNPDEAEKLSSTDYQNRTAWAIHLGILRFLAQEAG